MIFFRYALSTLLYFFVFTAFAQDLSRKSWKINYNKGVNYLEQDSMKQAWPYLREAYFAAEEHYKRKSKFKKSLLAFYKTSILTSQNGIIDSLNLTDEVLEISKRLKRKKRFEYSKYLDSFAAGMLKNGKFNHAIKLYEERKCVLNESNTTGEKYAKVLYGLGKSYKGTRKYNLLAKENLERSIDIVEINGPFDMVNLEDIFKELVPIYISEGNRAKADETSTKSLHLLGEKEGKTSELYTNLLNHFGVIYWRSGHLEKASELENNAVEIFESQGNVNSSGYLYANFVLALIEKDNNNYLESIEAFKKVQKIMISNNKTKGNDYAQLLGNIGLNYDRIGDYESALKYCNEALSIKFIEPSTKSIRLMDKAYFYQNMGRFKLSHQVYEEALSSMEVSHGKKHPEYAKLLNNIGKLYFEETQYDEALTYFKSAIDIIGVKDGEQWHTFYSYMLNDYAKTLFELGDFEKAIQLMQKNIAYFEANDKPKNEEYYNRKYSLSKAFNLTGNYKSALPLIEEATTELEQILGEDHIDYGEFLKTLSDTYFGLDQIDNGVQALVKSNSVFVNQIDKVFRFSSENEKKSFLEMITLNFNEMQSIAITKDLNNDQLNALNLNNQLMLKGLLLNNSKAILSELKTLNSEDINFKIKDYKGLKNRLSKVLTQPIAERENDADSLKLIINEKEAELVKAYTSNYGDDLSLVRNWEDTKKHLESGDIAIEFSHFNTVLGGKPTGEIRYVAYIYSLEQTYPQMISLFKERDLKQLISGKSPDDLYQSEDIYKLIFKPIEDSLNKASKVYYSPSGLLNQIAFSAIKSKNQVLVSKYDLIQLSSTYKLVEDFKPFKVDSSLLIGGVNYEYINSDENITLDDEKDVMNFLNDSNMQNSRGTKSRGESWTYLQGTADEVESLNILLKKYGTEVVTLKESLANESNFKKLSGKSPSLIHIATHGFFYENLNRANTISSNLSMEDQYRLADDPLLRSGLVLSGANYAWKNGSQPKNEDEDGILTALEISNLDLSTTKLVVLSACETGLGDIDGSEGVYGLQRAFKMAGVDQLIMSLWEVPDEETSEFMKIFYSEWLKGNTIQDAFVKTQRDMHTKYKNEPHRWAAFVLFE